MRNEQVRLRAAYEAAVQALSPLPRAAFLLCRLDNLSYRDIGMRLSISPDVVEDCIALALSTITVLLHGRLPDRPTPTIIAEAEAALFHEYRAYCARVILAMEPLSPETSNDSGSGQRDLHVMRSPQRWLARTGNWSMRSFWENWTTPTVPQAKTFDEWLRNRTGAANGTHLDQRHACTRV
jgi:hypothetical protein